MSAFAQNTEQNINVKIKPSQTVEERVADSIKERELREAAEEKLAAEKSELWRRRARKHCSVGRKRFTSGQALLNSSRSNCKMNCSSVTSLMNGGLALVDGYEKPRLADITIEVDRPLFTFTFTYKITDRANGILLASGEITAFDGNIAAPILSKRIIKDIKKARGETKK